VSKIRAVPEGEQPNKRRKKSKEEEEEELLDLELHAITREVLDLGPSLHSPCPRAVGLTHQHLILLPLGATQFTKKKEKKAFEERKIIGLGGQVRTLPPPTASSSSKRPPIIAVAVCRPRNPKKCPTTSSWA